MKPSVVLTHWVHPEVIELLAEHCTVIPNTTRNTLPPKELIKRTKDAQAIMVFMPDVVDEAFLLSCPQLKIVSAALKGYDNFDVDACTRHGVWFAIVQDLLTIPTAELAIGLLIGLTRRILEGDCFIRRGNFEGWRPHLYGTGLAGRTLGIIGMGLVGHAVAKRAIGLEMRVIYYDNKPLPRDEENTERVSYASLPELLAQSDFAMLLLPLTPDTLHLVNAQFIKQMKPGSYLVNVERGSVVDEQAIVEALQSGHLSGYAADVFEMEDWAREDRPRSIPQTLLERRECTLLTPHLGSAVDEIRKDIELAAARNILQALHGEKPDGAINSIVESKY